MDNTGTLRAKAFDDQCNRIFPIVICSAVSSFSATRAAPQELASRVPLQIIEIATFDVVVANKHYSSLPSDYEIILHHGTKVSCSIPQQTLPIYPIFHFVNIQEMGKLELNCLYGA